MENLMNAMVFRGPENYSIEKVPVPKCPEKGLLIKVKACGLCGSDLRTLRSGHKNVKPPWILGHEVSGEVVETGTEYNGEFKIGELLAVAPVVYCGKCEFCLSGHFELCENIRELAQHWPGGFAEYMAIPREALALGNVRRVPNGLNPLYAAIAEPMSSCVHAHEKANVNFTDTVLIIGAGPIGAIHTNLAKLKGAKRVLIADILPHRLELIKPFGPDITINAAEVNLVEEVLKITDGKGPEVIITANPAPITQVQAIEMAKKGGRVLFFGGLPKDNSKPGIDTNLIHYKGLYVIGITTFAPRHHITALELLRSGKIQGEKLVTKTFPLHNFKSAVQEAINGEVLKAVIIP